MKKQIVIISALLLILNCSSKTDSPIPKTLLFSPITPEYLHDTAADWKATGFDGFLFARIMRNWSDDIWAADGDSTTRSEDDQTYKRVKHCNDECRNQGITDNFIKVAFYDHIPLWTDDAAWEQFHQNFRETARFAKMTGCRGIALDIEYVSEQYDFDWEGYDYRGYSQTELRDAAVKRGKELVTAMLQSYPDMVFLTLPEGITFYGPLAADFFVGMVHGMAKADAPGGLHLLTESSYDMTSTLGLIHYARNLESKILPQLDEAAARYWKDKCTIALGGWPLGYYRRIVDENGNFLGYSGREENFGDRVVGSYADKSARFSPQDFRNQYAGLLLGSKRYCWIYGHGATWWQFSEADVAKYGNVGNSTLPVDERLDEFKTVVREKWRSTNRTRELSENINNLKADEFLDTMNFVKQFKVIGPFGSKSCNNFDKNFPPEEEIDFNAQYGQVRWQTCTVDSTTGYLDFLNYLKPTDWVCVYAYCKVISPKAVSAQLRLGTNDMGILWFNGEKVLSQNIERTAVLDDDIIPVQLEKGENTILVKVCNTEINWGMYLRITDDEGNSMQDLEFLP